jgi:hypothetical protein
LDRAASTRWVKRATGDEAAATEGNVLCGISVGIDARLDTMEGSNCPDDGLRPIDASRQFIPGIVTMDRKQWGLSIDSEPDREHLLFEHEVNIVDVEIGASDRLHRNRGLLHL